MFTVMIVDDEKAIREYLPSTIPFEEHGFQVCTTANNGAEALKKMEEFRPDVIFLDVNMPVMDGLTFLGELRSGPYKETKVIMLSGYNDFEYAKKAIRYDVKAYLTKPIEEEEALTLLDQIFSELSEKSKSIIESSIQQDAEQVKKLYACGQGNRKGLKDYFLMHCVALNVEAEAEGLHPYDVIQLSMKKLFGLGQFSMIRSRGSIYTYLVSRKITDAYQSCMPIFAKHFLYQLKEAHLECALLLDEHIFEQEEQSFREDYTEHLYQMLSEVFYGKRGYLSYVENKMSKTTKKMTKKELFLETLKSHLLEMKSQQVLEEFEALVEEFKEMSLGIEYLQENSFRIYYIIEDVIATIGSKPSADICQPPEWRDYPFFMSFEKWKEMQCLQIKGVCEFVENSRNLASQGVCKEVIQYVHNHYKEQITVKKVAEVFFMNEVYLGRIFKTATNVSFKQYVNDLRITEAKRLLIQTDQRIYEIASAVGYTESKYFVSKFTAEVGISPSQFRRG